jgi:outer membrane protein assembly factor BamB
MRAVSIFAFLLAGACFSANAERNWPQFRGPTEQGLAEAKDLPLDWSETKNLKWKTAIHGRAWSCPVVLENQIWMSSATEDGQELYAICVDLDSGKIIHDLKLFHVDNPQFAHKFNTYGSPTPAIEPGRVYITFGSPGTACLDTTTGKVLWERRDFVCNHFRGAGSSPIIYKDKILMNFDGSDHQFVVALDKNTGKTAWQTERSIDYKDLTPAGKPEAEGDWRKAFSTPVVADFGHGPEMLSLGSKAIYGYNPDSGKELWRVENRTCHSGSATPVVNGKLIVTPMGFSKGEVLAIKVDDKGLATEKDILWKVTRNAPNKPSVIIMNGLVFMIDDAGIASCLEAETGKEVWRERIGGNYSASPIYAEGKIYFFSEEGKTTVIAASREFQKLASCEMGDGFMATPAVADNAFILRSRTHLYRVEKLPNKS